MQWRATDRPSRLVIAELGRLGFDITNVTTADPEDEPRVAARVYLAGVGRKSLDVIIRLGMDGTIIRVVSGAESFTARQALPWLKKKAARDTKYLP